MKVSNRQREIIKVLLHRPNETTAAEIAKEVKVSTRTVHRELADIESILGESGISLLRKSGSGIQLSGDQEKLDALEHNLNLWNIVEYTPDERKVLTLCTLLESSEPVKLFSLANDLQVAVPTAAADLDEIEARLGDSGLHLVRRRGYGVELAGPEGAKRKMIARLAGDHLDDSDLFGMPDSGTHPLHPATRKLLDLIGKETFFAVERALGKLEEKWPTELSEEEYTRLLIRLSVAVTRIGQERFMDEPAGDQAAPPAGDGPETKLGCFAGLLDLKLPLGEKIYLARQLDAWNAKPSQAYLIQDNLPLVETVVDLIRHVADQTKEPLLQDRSLIEGLIDHLGPALSRIRKGETVRNPLTAQIVRDYGPLFQAVRHAVDDVVAEPAVPDEEIGYLVMHFGASLERPKPFPRTIRALLVCTSGIGSSKMLAVRLTKEFPQIHLINRVSWFEAARIPEEDYDLIISTVDLPLPPNRYIKMSPLLTQDEAEKLRSYIKNITLKRLPAREAAAEPAEQPLERLRKLSGYSAETIGLIERFDVYQLEFGSSQPVLEAVLKRICSAARDKSELTELDPVVGQLIERESHGSQVIPETDLALFHTRSDFVGRPFLSLFRLDRPLYLGRQEVNDILLMLAPLYPSPYSVEVLSEISAMLLLPEMMGQLKSGSAESVRRFLSNELESFIKSKMEWGEKP